MIIFGMVTVLFTCKVIPIHCQEVKCASGLCKNNALCEDTEDGFRCFCQDGFAGVNCEINFDDCSSSPCRNNATCTDLVAGYTCACSPGFTGQDCQVNIDECISSPCLQNGRCIDLVNGYVCECLPPFRGDNCSLLPCDNAPCKNEAICRNDVGFNESLSGFVCECITGFTGPRCEINLEDCDLENFTSCSGNGLCIDGINDYSCLCEPGWVGDYCDFPVDDCIGNGCKNNATCTDLHLGYMCTCKPGYEGSLCERERDECSALQPCENGAKCVDLFNSYRCECMEGWFGVNCSQEVNECETNQCQNNAQCIDVIGGYKCRCPPFYTGLLCEVQFNPCAPEYNPCQNKANCIVPPDGQYRCYCLPGFTGIHCEVNINECLSMPCENNATCEDITAGYICHCTPGWQGQNCQDNVDDCASEPCLNGADCMDLHNGFECNCTRAYQGPTCNEIVDFCLRNPCFHDSTCQGLVGGYKCLCSTPYTGEQCLDLIDACQSAPCVNNGTCMNTVSGYQCSCRLPYKGSICSELVDFCESGPCILGTCVSLADDFVCICPEYLTGKQCTDVVDYCQNSPCENDGNCINAEFDFRCICAYGFTGRTCAQMIDFCSEEPCQNEANCSNILGGFRCICLNGFSGELCQNKIPSVISSSILSTSSSVTDSSFLLGSSLFRTPLSSLSWSISSVTFSSITEVQTSFITSESFTQMSVSQSSVINYTSGQITTLSIDRTTRIVFKTISRPFPHSSINRKIALSTSFLTENSLSTGAIQVSSANLLSTSKFATESLSSLSSSISQIQHSKVVTLASDTPSNKVMSSLDIKTQFSSVSNAMQMSSVNHLTPTSVLKTYLLMSSTFDLQSSKMSSYITSIESQSITPTASIPRYISSISFSPSTTTNLAITSITNDLSRKSLSFESTTIYPTTFNIKSFSTNLKSHLHTLKERTISKTNLATYIPNLSTSGTIVSPSEFASVISSTISKFDRVTTTTIPLPLKSPTESSSFIIKTVIPNYDTQSVLSSSILLSTNTMVFHSSIPTYPSYAKESDLSSSIPSSVLSSLSLLTLSSESLATQIFNSKQESSSIFIDNSLSSLTKFVGSSENSFLSSKSVTPLSSIRKATSFFSDSLLSATQTFDWSRSSGIMFSSMDFSSGQHSLTSISSFSPNLKVSSSENTFSSSMLPLYLSSNISVSGLSSLMTNSYGQTLTDAVTKTIYDFSMSTSMSTDTVLLQSSNSFWTSDVLKTTPDFDFSSNIMSSFTASSVQSLSSLDSSVGTSIYAQESSFSSKMSQLSPSKMSGLVSSRRHLTLSSINVQISFQGSSEIYNATSVSEDIKTSRIVLTYTTISPSMSLTELSPGYKSSMSFLRFSDKNNSPSSAFQSASSLVLSIVLTKNMRPSTKSDPSISVTNSAPTVFPFENSKVASSSKYTNSVSPLRINSLSPSYDILTKSSSEGTKNLVERSSNDIVSSSEDMITPMSTFSRMSNKIFPSEKSFFTSKSVTDYDIESKSASLQLSTLETLQPSSHKGLSESYPSESASITVFNSATYSFESLTSLINSSSLIYASQTSTVGPSTSFNGFTDSTDFSSNTASVVIQPSKTMPSFTSSISTTTTTSSSSCEYLSCDNGGRCKEDIYGGYCDCGDNYVGQQCQTEATACDGYVCENGGTCTITLTIFNVQVPKCSCLLPFYGPRCGDEKLIYYPAFIGSSYIELIPPDIFADQSNELYVSIKTTQKDATVLYSANQEADYKQAAYIRLYLTNGKLRYSFSCDGSVLGVVETDMTINTGDEYEIVIRQVWTRGPGEWCSSAVIVNSRVFVSNPILTLKDSQYLGILYLGGIPRYTYIGETIADTHIMDGFIGCIHNLQVNKNEIDLVTMPITGVNIDNCNVPVCQHDPCKNGATCHSSGEEWFCNCLPGYGGALCERKLCDVNPCEHGGTCIIQIEARDQLCLCPFGKSGAYCDEVLPVTIPHFVGDQYGYSSYIAYAHPHYVEDDMQLEFDMILDDITADRSLILFMGNTGSYGGRRDYMAVGLEFGFLVYRFDLGSGYGQIYSANKLDETLQQHSIKLGRAGNIGWLKVDNQRNITGRSPGVLTALNTNSKLYFGNVDVSEIGVLPIGVDFDDGFKGCIYNIGIRSGITRFITPGNPPGNVINGRNVGQCSSLSCARNPCKNGANCRDLGASIYCVCNEGWKGTLCTDVITVCDLAHACGDGSTCVPNISDGYHCLCPLGKIGTHCEKELNISDPMFLGGGSYMAFQPMYIKRQIHIQLQIKPNSSEGLLFYVAQHLHSHSGDFLALTLNKNRIELRVDVGSGVNVIQNLAEVSDQEKWYTVEAGRNLTHFYITVDGETITEQLQGMMTFLDITTDFYIGGLPNLEDSSPEAFENEPVAFHGCIREFVVNGRQFQLDQNGAKYGRNIEDCDGTYCGYNVCKNGGTCSIEDDLTFGCRCTTSFVGETCDVSVQCSNHSCVNGVCRAIGDTGFKCDCFIGWKGKFCSQVVDIAKSVQFSIDSYMHFVDEDFWGSNTSETDIYFSFKTTLLNCLILWNGQTYTNDEDYLGVGIQDGRLKLVWNLGWYSRGEIITPMTFSDGKWHNVAIEREKQQLVLTVDELSYESRVSGDFYTLDTFGEFYIGTFKENDVAQNSLGYFNAPFNGCFGDLQINRKSSVDFSTVQDGLNILECDTN